MTIILQPSLQFTSTILSRTHLRKGLSLNYLSSAYEVYGLFKEKGEKTRQDKSLTFFLVERVAGRSRWVGITLLDILLPQYPSKSQQLMASTNSESANFTVNKRFFV